MPLRTGFQTFVNNQLPIGLPGDFASANPRASLNAGPGAFVAGPGGVTVGVFAWFDPVSGTATNYFRPGCLLGFIHRENNGLILLFLGIATMQVVPGNIVTGMNQGDYLGVFAAGATIGQKVYADPVTGALSSAATGGGVAGSYTGSTVTGGVLTTTTANLTGSAIAVGQLVTGGTLPEGTYVSASNGAGSGTLLWILANANGTAIPDQAAFTSGNTGKQETTYVVATPVKVNAVVTASIAVTGVMTVTAVGSGVLEAGQFLAAAGVPAAANAQIQYQLTGAAGGVGTYQTNYNAVFASGAVTASQGQIGAISSWQ